MPILLAIGAWLVSFWTSLTAALLAIITTRFAVAAFVGTVFLGAWLTFSAVIATEISSISALIDVPDEIVQWLSYMTPPSLSVCMGALLAAYLAQVVFRILTSILSIKTGG